MKILLFVSYITMDQCDLLIDRDSIKEIQVIGRGATCVIVKCDCVIGGKLINGCVIKKVSSAIDECDFNREREIFQKLNCPCCMGLLGYSSPSGNCLSGLIAMSHMQNGTLLDAIEQMWKGEPIVGWSNTAMSKCLIGCAFALKYIHGQGIMHLDFKAQNVLLNSQNEPLVSDFGTAHYVDDEVEGCIGSPIYMAPEILGETPQYSVKCDVYAFGIFLVYIADKESYIKWKRQSRNKYRLFSLVRGGRRPSISENIPNCLRDLINRCWDQSPNARPTMAEVCELLIADKEIWAFPGTNMEELNAYISSISSN